MRRFIPLSIVALASAALAVGAFALISPGGSKTVVRQVAVTGGQPAAEASNLSVTGVYDKARRGVVEITVQSTASNGGGFPFDGGSQTQQALGSGFVYDSAGHIVTNQHVVASADTLSVHFWDGSTYPAKVVGSDSSTDLAVIEVDAPSSLLFPLKVGDSDALQVGDGVVAIGSPFGLEGTVTSGIVSALHREMKAPNNFQITDSIQTDAAINHGNSGGPLLNADGKVIGVNSQIESDSGGNDGVGFAVPSTTVASIVPRLISNGNVVHAYLGVQLASIPQGVAQKLGVPAGVELENVKAGTPADTAGLRAATGTRTVEGQSYATGGDVIVGFDGIRITSSQQLQNAVDAKRPGDKVTITYVRGGQHHTVQVTLAARPS